MNLPASSLMFLPYFRGLLFGRIAEGKLPFSIKIHCHLFVKANADEEEEWYSEQAKKLVALHLGYDKMQFEEVHFVRKVAGRKEMYCVSFVVPEEILFMEENCIELDEKKDMGEEGRSVENGTSNLPTNGERADGGDFEDKEDERDDCVPPMKMARMESVEGSDLR
uniref:tRNA wybutosine-synthesizing protein 2 homolog n=1 Tax=Ascaris lumbricoides TaxID=6252 RepID=A0A0M3IU62_ASCLU